MQLYQMDLKCLQLIVGFELLKHNGSFSAEHGIGQLRKDSLKKHKNNVAYSLMQTIKNQIDPKGIMNPGKIL